MPKRRCCSTLRPGSGKGGREDLARRGLRPQLARCNLAPNHSMKRREFLLAAGAAALAAPDNASAAQAPLFKKRIKLGISTYSYWHFEEKRFPIETVMDRAAEIGVEGVDVLHRQMN